MQEHIRVSGQQSTSAYPSSDSFLWRPMCLIREEDAQVQSGPKSQVSADTNGTVTNDRWSYQIQVIVASVTEEKNSMWRSVRTAMQCQLEAQGKALLRVRSVCERPGVCSRNGAKWMEGCQGIYSDKQGCMIFGRQTTMTWWLLWIMEWWYKLL